MMSMEHSMHRMFPSNEDTRRLLQLSNLQRSIMSPDIRRDSSPQRRPLPDLSGSHQPQQQQTTLKRFAFQQPDLSGNSQPPAKRLAYQQQTDISGNSPTQIKRLAYQQQTDLSGNSPTPAKRLAYHQQTDLSDNSQPPTKRLAYQQQTDLSGNSQPPAKRLAYQQQTDLSGSNSQTQIKRLPYQQQTDLSGNNSQTQIKRLAYHHQPVPSGNAVSRRNARERKRVRLVNLGFSTLRERVPSGTKNKKLSKVETLRAAIEYIRQLQDMLGMEPDQELERMMMLGSENFVPDDCSSSEEGMVRGSGAGTSGDLSPASSHPSESSLVHYESQHANEDQLMDIGLWFS